MSNRNFPAFKPLTKQGQMEADGRNTSDEVWAAIENTATESRTAVAIWEDPTDNEFDHVVMMLNEWARLGDIEPGSYHWGNCTGLNILPE